MDTASSRMRKFNKIVRVFPAFTLLLCLWLPGCIKKSNPRNTGEGRPSMNEKVIKTEEEWKKILKPEQFRVLRKKGTEKAFSGEYWETKTPGIYVCAACGNELFSSETKYESGSGWPSFYAPIREDAVDYEVDRSFFMTRTEVLCSRCDSHLGHVFDDGPPPTGKRFCMNSICLKLIPADNQK